MRLEIIQDVKKLQANREQSGGKMGLSRLLGEREMLAAFWEGDFGAAALAPLAAGTENGRRGMILPASASALRKASLYKESRGRSQVDGNLGWKDEAGRDAPRVSEMQAGN